MVWETITRTWRKAKRLWRGCWRALMKFSQDWFTNWPCRSWRKNWRDSQGPSFGFSIQPVGGTPASRFRRFSSMRKRTDMRCTKWWSVMPGWGMRLPSRQNDRCLSSTMNTTKRHCNRSMCVISPTNWWDCRARQKSGMSRKSWLVNSIFFENGHLTEVRDEL